MKFLFFGILLFCSSCQNKYEKLDLMSMKEVMKIKQAEQGEQKTFDDDPEPAMPDLKKNEETVAGIDADNDGIRDDVEIWINRNFKTANERRAFKQYAGVQMQWIIKKQNGGSDEEMRNMHQPLSESMDCIIYVLKGFEGDSLKGIHLLRDIIRQLIINTDMRVKMDLKADIASRGGGATDFGKKMFERFEFCKFHVENQSELTIFYKQRYNE
jgi:hypothetical protein